MLWRPTSTTPEAIFDAFADSGRSDAAVEDFDERDFVGRIFVGERCFDSGVRTEVMVVADAPDGAFTALVQIRIVVPGTLVEEAVATALATFDFDRSRPPPPGTLSAAPEEVTAPAPAQPAPVVVDSSCEPKPDPNAGNFGIPYGHIVLVYDNGSADPTVRPCTP